MIRKAFVMQLHPGQVEEYRRRHEAIWPELERTLQDADVRAYSIFLHPTTLQLFAYAEIASEEKWAAVAETEVCRRWWAYMQDIMETNPDSSPASIPLEEVFQLAPGIPF
jgi:L-rhamnose mutarotase